jgi:hypothetical protein
VSGRNDDEWAVALTVSVLTALTIATLSALRIVLAWVIDVYRRRWPDPVLKWTLGVAAGAWGLAFLLAAAAPGLAAALAVVGIVGYLGGLVLVDIRDQTRRLRDGEPTVAQVLAPWWDDGAASDGPDAPRSRAPAEVNLPTR